MIETASAIEKIQRLEHSRRLLQSRIEANRQKYYRVHIEYADLIVQINKLEEDRAAIINSHMVDA